MNLEKIWDHKTKQESRSEIRSDILEGAEDIKGLGINNPDLDEPVIEQCGKEWLSFGKTSEALADVSSDDLYSWYATAMSRRNREPLDEESFCSHFFNSGSFEETFAYGGKENGFLLGFNKFGVFTPTHFAPKTLRGGYELFQSLGESTKIPAILAITKDLADTMDKIPTWHKLEIKKEIIAFFRGQIVKKEIYYNSHPEVSNLMMGLLMEYMNKNKEDKNPNDD